MIFAALALSFTLGPSFDCSRATATVEQAICADPDLALRDRAMALLYRQVQDSFEGRIRFQQRDWLRDRDRCQTNACVRGSYDRRLAQLAGSANFSEYLTHQRYVGGLQIAPVGEGWFFFAAGTAGTKKSSGETVLAEAAGLVRLKKGRGRWSSDNGCTLNFIQMPQQRWKVGENAACGQAFAGLSLGGMYMTEQDWWDSSEDAEVQVVG